MEVWILLAIFSVYAEWAVLGLLFCLGVALWASRRARRAGAALVVLSSGYAAFLFFTPERIALSQRPMRETKISEAPFVVPPVLVFHGNFDQRSEYDLEDGLTLAETGLFRVLLADNAPHDSIRGEAVFARASDCAEVRSRHPDAKASFPPKVGSLLFTARTGFERCATYVPGAVALPPRRLDLWKQNPPGEPKATLKDSLRGVMLLTLTEDGKQRVIARRVARARPVAVSRLGVYTYDSRPEYSRESGYLEYDPDVLDFVLAATHANKDALPRDGSVSDADLLIRADEIIRGRASATQKLWVAVALAGAMREGTSKSRAMLDRATSAFAERHRFLHVRVPSDCSTALRAATGRQAFASVCEATEAQKRWGLCTFPIETTAFMERCTDILRSIWNESAPGQKTLVLGDGAGESSDINISDMHGAAARRRILIRPEDGLLDLVLVAAGSNLWTLEGNIGCVDRVTVIGEHSGVVGIDPRRVQFRNRRNVSYRSKDLAFGERLDDLLGHSPDRTISAARKATTVIGERGLKSAPCRSPEEAPSTQRLGPDQVVTGPSDVVFMTH